MGGTIFEPLSYNFRHENNIFNSEQPYEDIEFDLSPHYYSDIIVFIYNIF